MSNYLYKYSANNLKSKIDNNYEVLVFKPTLQNPFFKDYCNSIKSFFVYLYWLFISKFSLAIYYVKDGDKIIHTSFVTGKSIKFDFMNEADLHIGPCITDVNYRGLGIYPKVLNTIIKDYYSTQKALYIIIEDSNISSIKGACKAGFSKIGKINKYRKLFIYRYALETDDWQYYNHSLIPNTAPHIIPDLNPLKLGYIWNMKGKFPLFARWTSNFDCDEKTNWFYVIKDNEYEIQSLNSNRRKKITRGRKNFYSKIIRAKEYKTEIAEISIASFSSYPINYRPKFSKNDIISFIENGDWDSHIFVGIFYRLTNELVGYGAIINHSNYIMIGQHIVKPSFEKYYVNYALVDALLTYLNKDLINQKKYIFNGSTNLVHKTNFYKLLIDCFGYRKAYCKLHIVYRPIIKPLVFILFLFRRTIKSFKNKSSLLYKINAVLEMEKIAREYRTSTF